MKRLRLWVATRVCYGCRWPLVLLDRSANPRACLRCWCRVQAAARTGAAIRQAEAVASAVWGQVR